MTTCSHLRIAVASAKLLLVVVVVVVVVNNRTAARVGDETTWWSRHGPKKLLIGRTNAALKGSCLSTPGRSQPKKLTRDPWLRS